MLCPFPYNRTGRNSPLLHKCTTWDSGAFCCWYEWYFFCGQSQNLPHWQAVQSYSNELYSFSQTTRLTLTVLNFWKFTSYCSLKPLWSGMGGSSAGSYLADPTSPIPSHCALIVATSTVRVNHITSGLMNGNECSPWESDTSYYYWIRLFSRYLK